VRIGELSARSGVSPRSLRYYEERGLLASERTAGGHREYGEDAVERVDRVQCLLGAGLTTDTIRELLPCVYARERGEPAPDLLDWLTAERDRVTGAIRGLERTREALDQVIENARVSSPADRADGSVAPGARHGGPVRWAGRPSGVAGTPRPDRLPSQASDTKL
jgi:DNA-binding transcriptional MerR regulator